MPEVLTRVDPDDSIEKFRSDETYKAALARFRNSVGFQFMFVLHSGLEVERAVEHVCSAAERFFQSAQAQHLKQ